MKDLIEVSEVLAKTKKREELSFPISRELLFEIMGMIDQIPGYKGNYHPENTVGNVVTAAINIKGGSQFKGMGVQEKPKRKVFLFNTTIITGGPGCYQLRSITVEEAREIWNDPNYEKVSAIGHQATADIMSVLLGEKIPLNRIEAEQKTCDMAICLKINGRIPEGTVLTEVEQIEKIGYKLYRLTNDGAMY